MTGHEVLLWIEEQVALHGSWSRRAAWDRRHSPPRSDSVAAVFRRRPWLAEALAACHAALASADLALASDNQLGGVPLDVGYSSRR